MERIKIVSGRVTLIKHYYYCIDCEAVYAFADKGEHTCPNCESEVYECGYAEESNE